MSSTYHLQVYDAFVAAISALPALASGNIKTMRNSNRAMAADVTSQIRVTIDQSLPTQIVGGTAPADWQTTLRVDCLARDVVDYTTTKALDTATALAASVQKRVLESASLQELIIEINPAPMQWTEDEADTGLMVCRCLFTLVHRTPYTNLIV
jgi:hypothetical protein